MHSVVRASLGAMSNDAEIDAFVNFLQDVYVEQPVANGYPSPPMEIENSLADIPFLPSTPVVL
jgi:hypothetical protein